MKEKAILSIVLGLIVGLILMLGLAIPTTTCAYTYCYEGPCQGDYDCYGSCYCVKSNPYTIEGICIPNE